MDYQQRAAAWLEDPAIDEATKEQIRALAADPKELEDCFYRDLEFGTAGMRGVIGVGTNRMNRYMVRKATAGLAAFLQEQGPEACAKGVAIAYDSRRFSDEFARETAQVLCAAGVHAYLYEELRPVPMLSFAVRELGCAAGVIITASHNPKQYNGYKVYGPTGGQMEPEDADIVTAHIARIEKLGAVARMDLQKAEAEGLLTWLGQALDDRYFAQVKTVSLRPEVFAQVDKGFRVVYTPLHGSGSMPVQRALREAGVKGLAVVREQEQPDPDFSTVRVPNPEEGDALQMAMALADQEGADLCVGTDPDCDRMGLAVRDAEGGWRLLTGNQTGCILLNYILTARRLAGKLPENGAAVRSVVSTRMSDAIAAAFGVDMFTVLTGFKFIAGKIAEFEKTGSHQYLFGFEESFGYMAGAFVRDKDAVQASLLAVEAAAYYRLQGKTLLDALYELYEQYGYYLEGVRNFAFAGKAGMEKIAGIMTALRENPPRELAGRRVIARRDYKALTRFSDEGDTALEPPATNMLYFEIEGEQSFIIRPSGTEPKIKLYFGVREATEQKAKASLEALADDVVRRYMEQ